VVERQEQRVGTGERNGGVAVVNQAEISDCRMLGSNLVAILEQRNDEAEITVTPPRMDCTSRSPSRVSRRRTTARVGMARQRGGLGLT
jgi:hypothetical protein